MANCTLEPPVSTPISRSTAIEALRMIWYSLSVSVCAGATVIESPVCTPIGSRFSIEQTMMQLSLRSRTTSISNSFQPSSDSSISSSLVGWQLQAALADLDELFAVVGDAAALPPMVKDGRMMDGKPRAACTCSASSMLWAMPERARAEADLGHRLLELLAVLGLVDGLARGADHLDAVLLQHAVLGQVERAVERGLAAHGRQQRVGTLLGDDLLEHRQVIGSM
jgi:hypothetical protein